MIEIMSFLSSISNCVKWTEYRQLIKIVESMLCMTGRVSMLGLSRWSNKGGSYRTIQRFFNTTISWSRIQWTLIMHFFMTGKSEGEVILLAGDGVMVTKSGKNTYGIGRFFSSLYGKAIPGISFLSLSLISVNRRRSYSIAMEQVKGSETESKKAEKTEKGKKKHIQSPNKKSEKKKSVKGRKKGSKNRNKQDMELSPYLQWVQTVITGTLKLIGHSLSITYFVFDGAFGNAHSLQMVKECGLHLISKLRHDSSLWFPYHGEYQGYGPHRKYGKKRDYKNIPVEHLKSSGIDEHGLLTQIYQMQMRHREFADLLNIVVIVKTKRNTGQRCHVVLFTDDLALSWDKMIDYYHLRFQIEFNFRDAKQFWGLEDFMNIKSLPVYNTANLAMFMVNVSAALIDHIPGLYSVNDLKSLFRGYKYVQETLKCLPILPDPIFITSIYSNVASLGRIHKDISAP